MSQYYRSPGNSDKTTRKANGSLQENMLMAGRIGELLEEVCSNLSKVKIEETVMLWLARNRLDRNEATSQNTLIEAFAFAAQLLLFTPSMTGIRLIDRFIRDRRPKCRPSDLVALHALEQSRFHLLRLKSRTGPLTVCVEDLATAIQMTLLDDEISDRAMGAAVGVYLTPISNDYFITIGAITPLDAPALAEGLSFIRQGKGLGNP